MPNAIQQPPLSRPLRASGPGIALAMLLALLWAPTTLAAGRVTLAYGEVEIERAGVAAPAQRGQRIEEADLLRTGAGSFLHVRMDDGAVIALRPGTEFQIEAYRLPPTPPPAADPLLVTAPQESAATSESGGRALLRLLKGGFRTISGFIGKSDVGEYRVLTPVATIGVRGTDYTALLCNADCRSAPNGLHAKVSQGAVSIRNLIGDEQIVLDEEYVYVATGDGKPQLGLVPPEELSFELPPPSGGGFGEIGGAPPPPGTAGIPDTTGLGAMPQELPEPPEPPNRQRPESGPSQAYAFGFVPTGGPLTEARLGSASEVQTDAQGNLVAFVGENGAYALGSAQQRDAGFDPDSGLRWGRWAEGSASVNGQALDLSRQSLHWILGPELEAAPVIARSGSARYTLVGNTNPTDEAGHLGFLGNAGLTANFSDQTVQSTLQIGLQDRVWNAGGSGQLLPQNGLFGGAYTQVSVDGVNGGSGGFTGFFTPANAAGVPAGAGLQYSVSSGQTTVTGAAVFGSPSASGVAP